jgi:hypothetical protein
MAVQSHPLAKGLHWIVGVAGNSFPAIENR